MKTILYKIVDICDEFDELSKEKNYSSFDKYTVQDEEYIEMLSEIKELIHPYVLIMYGIASKVYARIQWKVNDIYDYSVRHKRYLDASRNIHLERDFHYIRDICLKLIPLLTHEVNELIKIEYREMSINELLKK